MSRRVLLALSAVVAATLIAGAGGGAGGAAAVTAGHATRAVDCIAHFSARVPKWAPQVHEPGDIGAVQSAQLAQQIAPRLAAVERASARGNTRPGQVVVPTWVHVIAVNKPGLANVTDEQIDAQIDVLNRSYSGATGGARTVFRFALAGVTRTVKGGWARMDPESPQELTAKRALHRGGPETLNLYVVADILPLLGWAYLPDGAVEHTPLDGVVVLADSLPGGDLPPYNEGDTATHEVGHWLSLLHTFDNGCERPGDEVADTPYEAGPAFGCPTGLNTCPQPGSDPVENFMDYTDDPCMHQFTRGQALRMWAAWQTFRASG